MREEFEKAFEKTMKHEGKYSNDPDDAGAETYMGISRRYHPNWPGWIHIDHMKKISNWSWEKEMLLERVRKFYKERYWDTWRGDDFINQQLANEMFDTAVNMGVMRAAMFLQKSINLLNRNQQMFKNLVVDGKVGQKTLEAIDKLWEKGDIKYVVKLMNIFQGMHYINYMTRSEIQEKFARGWLNRIEISK